MEGVGIGKGIGIGINLISELFRYQTRRSCLYNKTAEKRGSFCSFIIWDIGYKVMR